jgi:hypothetical protein
MSASKIFALAHGSACQGDQECYHCTSPCTRERMHDEPPLIPFVRRDLLIRRPSSPYVCEGCWLWRRGSVTVNFLSGGSKDRQRASEHSWWITPEGAWGVREKDHALLLEYLLDPPNHFCLMLRESTPLRAQCGKENNFQEIHADTPLAFSVDHAPMSYTVYELEEALKHGPEGKEPGVRELMRILHPQEVTWEDKERELLANATRGRKKRSRAKRDTTGPLQTERPSERIVTSQPKAA